MRARSTSRAAAVRDRASFAIAAFSSDVNVRNRKALLEAAPALFEYIAAAGIEDDLEGPE